MTEHVDYSKQQAAHRKEEERASSKDNRRFIPTALRSLTDGWLVAREFIGIAILWGAYVQLGFLVDLQAADSQLAAWVSSMLPLLFWTAVVITIISMIIASFKSAIPALLALLTAISLGAAGLWPWYLWALLAANISTAIYAVGFTFLGGRWQSR